MDILVTAEWLQANIDKVKILDASTHLPTANRDADAEFAACHIAGSGRFDINEIADQESPLPHMIPPASEFAAAMSALGISDNDHVVIYDDSAIFPAARAWWMLRLFGHENVSVLNGGLSAWRAIGGATEIGEQPKPQQGRFTTRPSVGAQHIDMPTIQALLAAESLGQLIDARAANRFSGEAPEPRKGLRAGHIPGSINVPLGTLIDENGFYKSTDEIRAAFLAGNANPDRPAITSCGSGVTACGLALGLALLGNEQVFVYDGSWTEWGASNAPIETGV